jgi:hypothetical protein
VKASPLARQFDRSPIQSKLGGTLNKLTPNSALGKTAYNILKDGDQAATTYALQSQFLAETLGQTAEKISKQVLKTAGSKKEEVVSKFQKLLNDRFTDFGRFKTDDFVFDGKGNVVPDKIPESFYALPKEIVKVNSKGDEFRIANPAFKKRENLHNFMRNTLKATDDDILELENNLLVARGNLDLNSLSLNNNFLQPLIKQTRDFLKTNISKTDREAAEQILKKYRRIK